MSARIGLVEELGRRLLWAGVVYTVLSMIIVYGALASGVEPPPILPGVVIDLYRRSWDVYVKLAGKVYNVTAFDVLAMLADSITLVMNNVLAVIVTMVSSFLLIAWSVTSALPYPLSILSVPIWAAAAFANLILVLYMLQKFADMIQAVLSRIAW